MTMPLGVYWDQWEMFQCWQKSQKIAVTETASQVYTASDMLLNIGEPLNFKVASLYPDLDKLLLYLDLNKLWSLCCCWTHLVWSLIWLLYSASVLGIHSIISISIYLIHRGSLSNVTESMLSYHWQFSCQIVSPSIFSCTQIPCLRGCTLNFWISFPLTPLLYHCQSRLG